MAGIKIWKKIPGYPNYSASNHGDIRRDIGGKGTEAGKIHKGTINSRGYLTVKLYRGNVGKTYTVHALIALTFIGPRPDGLEVCHFNDIKDDNRLGNLIYGTPKLNAHHAKLNGRTRQGETHGLSKLSEREVHAIRNRLRNGEPIRKIAGDFGVSSSAVRDILHGRTWSSWKSLGSKLRGFRSRVRRVGNFLVTSSSTSSDPTKTVNGRLDIRKYERKDGQGTGIGISVKVDDFTFGPKNENKNSASGGFGNSDAPF